MIRVEIPTVGCSSGLSAWGESATAAAMNATEKSNVIAILCRSISNIFVNESVIVKISCNSLCIGERINGLRVLAGFAIQKSVASYARRTDLC